MRSSTPAMTLPTPSSRPALPALRGMLLLLALVLSGGVWGQLTLPSGTSYTQDYDGIGSGLPTGWTVRTGATSESRGSTATFLTSMSTWGDSGGAFKNCAAGEPPLNSSSSTNDQNNSADRALSIRQSSSFGDPGAAFELQISNTVGRENFELSLKHQMLSVQSRSTTWTVQYSTNNGTSWTSLGTYSDPGTWGSTTGSYSFGSAIDDLNSTVLIRIVALSASGGSGNRDTYGIDDFELTWDNIAPLCTPPTDQPTAFDTTSVQQTQMTIDWNRGNGDSVIVLARQGGAVNANPVNGTDYTADAAFGSGSQIGSGNYVVYKGTGTSVTVTGLAANTAYHFALYEFDDDNGDPCYNTTSPLTGNATTLPIPPNITHTGTSPAASDIAQGSVNNVLYQVEVDVADGPATLTQLVASTGGTFDSDDLDNFKLWFSTDDSFNSASDVLLATISNPPTGDQTFSVSNQVFPVGTRYLFITCDVDVAATIGNTVSCAPDADGDFTYTESETYSGSSFAAANAKTFIGTPEIQLEYPVATNVDCGFTMPFGPVVVNADSSLTFRIRNTGSADLVLSGLPLTLGGADANQFSITTQPTSPIAPGGFSDVTVRFTPTSTGSKSASITIANNDNNEGSCAVNLTGSGVLANDECAGAISLTVHPTETCAAATNGTSTGGTESLPAITCASFEGNADDDVWYSFVATDTSHIITVDGASNMDAVIDLREGACNGTNIACADATDNDGIEVLTATGLTINSTYYIRIYDYDSGGGDFTICVTTPEPPRHYRTKASGLWSAASTWESSEDGNTWEDATEPPSSDALSVTLLSPHDITINASVTIDEVTVSSGSTLDVTGGTLTIANGDGTDLLVQGVLVNSTTSAFIRNSGAEILVANGGKYQHNPPTGAGSVTAMSWNSGSTCEITKSTAVPGNLNQVYHHFIWNSSTHGVTTINLVGGLKTVNGNLTIQNTGTGKLRLTGGNANTLNVGGDLIIFSGTTLDLGNGDAPSTVNVNGNLTNSGTLDLMGGSPNNGLLSIKGSLSGNGSITEGTSGTDCRVEFNGTTTQSAAFGSVSNRVNIEIDNSQGVSLASNLTMPSNTALIFTSGNLQLNEYILNMEASGTAINGASASRYVETNGTGTLQRTVGTSPVTFPVGNTTYNPMILTRSANSAVFSVRVLDGVYEEGLTGNAITDKVVDRTWDVNLVTGSVGTLSLTAQWNASEEIGGFDRANSYLSHYTGGVWVGDTPAAAAGGDPYTRTRTGITSLSPFAMGSQGSPLPVELTRFEARPEAEGVALRWETASELNNELFEVQHSADGRQFRVLGEVPGAGTTLLTQQYDYLHQTPQPGSNYYRLRQVDYDGRYEYSPVRVVEWGGAAGSAGDWSLRPTVTSDLIHLIRREVRGEGRWAVLSPSGRLVREGSIGADADMLPIDVATLPPGIWLLQVRTRQGVWTERFQKI